MRRGQQLHAGADLDVRADRDRRAVENDRAEVQEAARADADREPVVAPQRRGDECTLADRAEQLVEDLIGRAPVGDARRVEALDEQPAAQAIGGKLRIVGQ